MKMLSKHKRAIAQAQTLVSGVWIQLNERTKTARMLNKIANDLVTVTMRLE